MGAGLRIIFREWVLIEQLGLYLGYEELNDHDHLRTDPLFCTLVDRVTRDGKATVAGKSTLSRLELTKADASAENRCKKIVYDGAAIERFFGDLFIEAQGKNPPVTIRLLPGRPDELVRGPGMDDSREAFQDRSGHHAELPTSSPGDGREGYPWREIFIACLRNLQAHYAAAV